MTIVKDIMKSGIYVSAYNIERELMMINLEKMHYNRMGIIFDADCRNAPGILEQVTIN